jgi:tetratricopeptide (TPR) repeat protein
MEYVEGTPIDVYASRIPMRDRLILFLRVCEAVSYAHRHLVIHRDLKPSNILVDVSGSPKLLDFGIARLLEETGAPTHKPIQTTDRLLTPAYASPEQIRGAIQTTATDIYSLGAILYKLLTGRSPHESESGTLQAIDIVAGKKEIETPSRVNPTLPADLDYIVKKALRPEPDRRYTSVEAFAGDIRAYLEFRPVEARLGNAWYRARKFLRRYWLPVTAAALVVASLLAGLHMANRERAVAQRRFSEVRQLAAKLFDIDAQARELPGSTKTRQLIVDTALEYLGRLDKEVRGDPGLALEVGNAYMRVARVQGVPISPTLGQSDLAKKNLGIAEGFIQSVLKAQPSNRTAMLRAAQIAHDQMILARFDNHSDDAVQLARKSANWLEKFAVRKDDEAEAPAILTTYLNVADQFQSGQHFEEALQLSKRGIEAAELFNRSASTGTMLWVEAKIFQQRGDLDQALKAVQESTRFLDPGAARTTKGGQTGNFQLALVFEGQILGDIDSVSLGRSEEAVKVLDQAFRIADERVHLDANDHESRGGLATAGIPLAGILSRSDAARALEIYDHTLRHLAEVGGDVHLERYEVNLLAGSSYPLRQVGRFDEARRHVEMAFERLKHLKFYPAEKIYPGSEAQETLQALADYEADRGNLPRALSMYQELLEKIQPAKSGRAPGLNDAVHLSNIYSAAAALYRDAGQVAAADALQARRRDLWRQWDLQLPNNAFVQRQLRTKILRKFSSDSR